MIVWLRFRTYKDKGLFGGSIGGEIHVKELRRWTNHSIGNDLRYVVVQ